MQAQLLVDLLIDQHGIVQRAIHQVHQHPGALDVTQELVTKPDARVRSLDQTWYVHHDERLAAVLDDPERRVKRRERVVGDFRPSS